MSFPALRVLREQGVDVVHTSEIGLAGADDADVLRHAQRDGRILVTRNYQDFAPLVRALAGAGEALPGVLFIASSVRHSDVGGHVATLGAWIEDASQRGSSIVEGGVSWLR
ncbi:hypothetical protein BH23GEM2_BH23GEM2_20310 [soil metagenome]